jgi:hypothetical protein
MTGFTVPQRGPETDALIALLRDAGLLTGDAQRPAAGGFPGGDSTQQFEPYAVLYTASVIEIGGPMGDPWADTSSEYQVTAVGETAAQARAVADKARGILLGARPAVPDRHVEPIAWTLGHAAERDDDETPVLYSAVDVYTVNSTPG